MLALGPLPFPQRGEAQPGSLHRFPAVQLFVDRAAARDAAFRLTPEGLEAVAAICRRLDGLPLAIELAAGWAYALTPLEMLDRLPHPSLLGARERRGQRRHESLDAAVAWSYDLLSSGERMLLSEETVRDYAARRLAESGDLERFRRAHAPIGPSLGSAAAGASPLPARPRPWPGAGAPDRLQHADPLGTDLDARPVGGRVREEVQGRGRGRPGVPPRPDGARHAALATPTSEFRLGDRPGPQTPTSWTQSCSR